MKPSLRKIKRQRKKTRRATTSNKQVEMLRERMKDIDSDSFIIVTRKAKK